jgi:hypothetical protein
MRKLRFKKGNKARLKYLFPRTPYSDYSYVIVREILSRCVFGTGMAAQVDFYDKRNKKLNYMPYQVLYKQLIPFNQKIITHNHPLTSIFKP